ncbi:hypothetical protein TWF106_007649 [Orbilia oligospora]|uniref:Uncharacterized protein n=1 Tax=Orbilia oligospora TaxID=2813651 RepID=A0A7C8UJW2_ORBOL|nr:hypothetical protein TWF788_002876 [Orbilia oligospora]KAF3218287.1 hypothetical protein TWF106_007649 [Orbilia oligospora]
MFYIHAPKHYVHRQPIRRPPLELPHRMRMCWAAFALDAEESGWDDFVASRKSISSSPSLSVSNEPITATTTTTTTTVVSATQSPTTPTSTSIPGAESHLWTSSTTTFEPVAEWQKDVGATFPSEPVIVDIDDGDVDVDVDMDMVMDMDVDIDVSHHDIMMSTLTTTTTTTTQTVVTPSEQQEWRNTIDAQVEEGRKQLEMTTIQIERVEEVIKPAKRYIPTKITAYFPSSPVLSIPVHLRPSSADIIVSTSKSRRNSLKQLEAGEINEEEEERKQRELLEELARSLSSVSIRTTRSTRTQTSTQVVKGKPPPIGIGMMMGFKSVKSESASTSPRLKGKEVDFSMAPTKITKRGVITGARGSAITGRGRGAVMKRRNSGGSYRGETISL